MPPGTKVYLLRQQTERGLVAVGRATTGVVVRAPHWTDPGKEAKYLDVDWDVILPVADRLPTEDLPGLVPGVQWRYLQASGTAVPAEAEADLDAAWNEHVGGGTVVLPGEEGADPTYREGDKVRVEVNRYERDPKARQACLAHHGYACIVCGFDFAVTYGHLGVDYIVVHHVKELSTLGPDYKVDPKRDLVPVCANCHAMLHRERPAIDPNSLRQRLRDGAASS